VKVSRRWRSRLGLGMQLLALVAFIVVGAVVILPRTLPTSSFGGKALTEARYYTKLVATSIAETALIGNCPSGRLRKRS